MPEVTRETRKHFESNNMKIKPIKTHELQETGQAGCRCEREERFRSSQVGFLPERESA